MGLRTLYALFRSVRRLSLRARLPRASGWLPRTILCALAPDARLDHALRRGRRHWDPYGCGYRSAASPLLSLATKKGLLRLYRSTSSSQSSQERFVEESKTGEYHELPHSFWRNVRGGHRISGCRHYRYRQGLSK